jgi:uncharacterized repeat protein (TIGR03803 family)
LPAQSFTTLLDFDLTNGGCADYMGLVQATDGNFYGTTACGGVDGDGTVFKITPKGALTTLYSFSGSDGKFPTGGLIQASDGNFYGTCSQGGAFETGTVFKITAAGALTTLNSFENAGSEPIAGVVQGTDGNFYGATVYEGTFGYGTIFRMTPGGTLTTLHNFDNTDGWQPYGRLLQAADGNFYGTTLMGGGNGGGTIFKITPKGAFTALYNFCAQSGCPDGENPNAGLIQAADGNLYGTTFGGGSNSADCGGGCGTVFKINSSGVFTSLLSFDGTHGSLPFAALVQATDGNFYEPTPSGGTTANGTIVKITPDGALSTVHNFDGNDGNWAQGQLLQATDGTLYGTATLGGNFTDVCPAGCGTVFSLGVGLGPFVETQTSSGKVGAKVIILGNNLTGSTGVTFNGTAAKFTVIRSTEISTTVPTGATTGRVEVTTPKRTLGSNAIFRVTK